MNIVIFGSLSPSHRMEEFPLINLTNMSKLKGGVSRKNVESHHSPQNHSSIFLRHSFDSLSGDNLDFSP